MLNEQALNATDVAELLHIGRNAVYALAKSGELPSYRMGRKILFTLDDVEAYAESLRVGGRTDAEASPSATPRGHWDTLPSKVSQASPWGQGAGTRASGGKGERRPADAAAVHGSPALGGPIVAPLLALPERGGAEFVIAGHGVASDLFVERLELSGRRAMRLPLESYASLVALYEGHADAAVVHLYDQRTNSYNVPYVQRLAPGVPVLVIRLVRRFAGFAVAPGNPLGLSSWGALLREGVRVANRPIGCGARVLLDEKLLAMEANPASLADYGDPFPTALAAVRAVSAGRADVAVIDEALAAQTSGIAFVPLQRECVDVVVSKTRGREFARLLQAIVADEAFRREYDRIVIGDTSQLGSIVYEC